MTSFELLWSRETWSITVAVLFYVIACGLNVKRNIWLRLAIPLALTITLHTGRFFLYGNIELAKLISDMLYDYFTPIGIYRVGVMIGEQILRKHKGGRNDRV